MPASASASQRSGLVRMNDNRFITLAHGNGGCFMRELIADAFARHLANSFCLSRFPQPMLSRISLGPDCREFLNHQTLFRQQQFGAFLQISSARLEHFG
jgi:hypothetical protein